MNALRVVFFWLLLPTLGLHAADVSALLAAPRQRIESADYRLTGRIIRVDAAGSRTTTPLSIRAHGFPGVLRVLVEVGQPSAAQADMREHILLEMHPDGVSAIRIARPGDTAARILPFERWSDPLPGAAFTYEDFLEDQYFWPDQTSLGEKKYGARNCQILVSRPGTAGRTHYAEVKTWLDASIGFPVYAEKTMRDSGAVNEFTYLGLRRVEGVWSASQVEVNTRGQSGSTLLIVDSGSPKAHLKLEDFNPRQLTRF